ncbi:hypothetical protein KIN20_005742 [Parelaphostrongylus tenuis]|uniref:Secreted protein n=1 Tax=Parelaphostrongylus tenuis TaxID=148309 RepID=A0AAD5QKF3_PARTN|nr:hypothetical protein KIN20_005742 [Parelaphostrongylus tenuis]
MTNVSTPPLLIVLLTITEVLGCGTLPGGPAAMRMWRFNVTGFSLPVPMAFSTAAETRKVRLFEQKTSVDTTSHGARAASSPSCYLDSEVDQWE